MAKTKQAIGVVVTVLKAKNRRRSKPMHLRGSKKLGPRDTHKGNRSSQ